MLEQVDTLHSLIKYTSAFSSLCFFIIFFYFVCLVVTPGVWRLKRSSIAFATAVEGEGDTHKRKKERKV